MTGLGNFGLLRQPHVQTPVIGAASKSALKKSLPHIFGGNPFRENDRCPIKALGHDKLLNNYFFQIRFLKYERETYDLVQP
jgi:hypothetical protein